MEDEHRTARILIVEDDAAARRLLVTVLESHGYAPTEASNADEARRLLDERDFDLVVTDLQMPGESGIDLIRFIGETKPGTATIMVSGLDDREVASESLARGSYGYIVKPFTPNEILIHIMNALRRRDLEEENKAHRERLEGMVRDRTKELWSALMDLERSRDEVRLAQEETIHRLSMAAEFRDDETARHIDRMSRYCGLLALRCGYSVEEAAEIELASVMHDIGKIGIPDEILRKPGPLTPMEFEIMKRHTSFGYRILESSSSRALILAATVAHTHHERVDGRGYPVGLIGEDIPRIGRIATIADVFDALTTDRIYRKRISVVAAVETMQEGRGTQFDPDILDIFLSCLSEIIGIKENSEGAVVRQPA